MTTFKKIRKGNLQDAFINTAICGLSAGGGAVGLLLILNKLFKIHVPSYLYILLGVSVALVSGAVSFTLIYKSKKRLARKLDFEFDLGEKVLTMVQYEHDDNPMVCLQRDDTERILSGIPYKKPLWQRFLAAIIVLAIGAGLLATGIVIPKDGEPAGDPTDVPFAISEWQLGALGSLIEEVRYSEIDDGVKSELVSELERLLGVLKTTTTQSKMTDEVVASIVAADLIVENANTYKKICVALDGGEEAVLGKIAMAIINLNGIGFGEKLVLIREELVGEDVKQILANVSLQASEQLARCEVNADDGLLCAVKDFTDALGEIGQSSETDENIIASYIDKEIAEASDAVGTQISAQYRRKVIRDKIISKLVDIFDIPRSEIPALLGDIIPKLNQSDEESSGDGDDNQSSGGYGDGNNLFGSDDIIFHPTGENGGEYVKYGEVYDQYYRIIEEILLYGDLDENTQKILIEYFTRLSDGSKS